MNVSVCLESTRLNKIKTAHLFYFLEIKKVGSLAVLSLKVI